MTPKLFYRSFCDFFLKRVDSNRVFICYFCFKTSVITKTLEIDSKQTSLPCNAVLNLKLLPTKKLNESCREKNARIACSSESVQTSVYYGNFSRGLVRGVSGVSIDTPTILEISTGKP